MVSLIFLTTISKSPKTFNFFTFNSMVFFRPWTRDSYFVVLFVHSNSSLQERKCLLFSGSIRTQPVPNPSYFLEPSKYKIQNLSSKYIWLVASPTLVTKFTILQSMSSSRENRRRPHCVSDS